MKFYFTLFFTALTVVTALKAQPGTIDKNYGTDKTGTVSFSNKLYVQASCMQQDNKLLTGGSGAVAGEYNVTRHNRDGSIDTSFGKEGITIIKIDDLVKNILGSDGWQSIAVQPDGKIVATGSVYYYNPDFSGSGGLRLDNDIVIAQFLPDGTSDESFGNKGRLITNLSYIETATAVTVQTDGKILVAGYQSKDADGNGTYMLLLRYNKDGSLDESFGKGQGYVKYNNSQAYTLLVQPDGKIIVGGSAVPSAYFFLVRYMPDGLVDDSFGNEGQALTNFGIPGGGINQINSLALDEKGRITAAGVVGAEQRAAVVRYLPNGTLDNSFNEDGKLIIDFERADYSFANTVLVQSDGKTIISSAVAGGEYNNLWKPVLTGLNDDGSLDASFANNSQPITDIGFSDVFSIEATMQNDGKIIVAGNSYDDNTNQNSYVLSRFNGYPVKVPLYVRIKKWLQNHGISWRGLPAEDNIAYYSIERSSERKIGFAEIAKVSGISNFKNYSITNSNLLQGMNYYRVKAVSADGTIRYSEVVSADNTASTTSVYPNPAKDYVTVQGLKTNEKAEISIADGSGTVLVKGVSNGSVQYRSQTNNLQPGTYYVNIKSGDKTETLKFVKD